MINLPIVFHWSTFFFELTSWTMIISNNSLAYSFVANLLQLRFLFLFLKFHYKDHSHYLGNTSINNCLSLVLTFPVTFLLSIFLSPFPAKPQMSVGSVFILVFFSFFSNHPDYFYKPVIFVWISASKSSPCFSQSVYSITHFYNYFAL